MNFPGNRALSLMVLAGTLGATASQARAEAPYRAKFDLPVEAQWGSAVLPPGHYTISMNTGESFQNVISIRGKSQAVSILAGPSESTSRGHGQITLLDVDGKYVVSNFVAGSLGRSFTMTLSKEIRNALRDGDAPKTSVLGVGD